MSDMDADDWDTGTEYTLYIGSGPTRAQVEAVLDPHLTWQIGRASCRERV